MLNQISYPKLMVFCGFIVFGTMVFGCSMFKFQEQKANANYTPKLSKEDQAVVDKFRQLDTFKTRQKEFTVLPEKVQLTKEPYLKGKVAVYKTSSLETVLWHGYLTPDQEAKMKDLLAQTADEVGTVVWLADNSKKDACPEIKKSDYKVEGEARIRGAYVEVCEMTIIDITIPAVVFRKKFEGVLKDTEFVRKDDYIRARVNDMQFYDFLSSLPRK
jgi:hypothetical protein